MAIVRWEPFRDLVTVQDRMNRVFDEAFRGAPAARGGLGARRQPGRRQSTSSSTRATWC